MGVSGASRGTSDGSRGGSFFVNVSNPGAWGTFELESMAFHEGIPGHQFIFEPNAEEVLRQLLEPPALRD